MNSDDPAELELLAEISAELVAAVAAELPGWVTETLERFGPLSPELVATTADRCRTDVVERLQVLMRLDIDQQSTTPLAVLRSAAAYPTTVLRDLGVVPPQRDPFDVRADPDDVYALAPRTWTDIGPEVGEAGLRWGAAKAHIHLRRHQPPR